MTKQKSYSANDVSDLNEQYAQASAEHIIAWGIREFSRRITLASSFGAEDVVLIDLLSKATNSPKVFFIDTGRLHQQTYDVVDKIRRHYEIEIETYFPQTQSTQKLVQSKGPNSFYESIENRRECCYVRKVEPLSRALSDVDGWFTGLRRSQSLTRTGLAKFELDETHGGILKINPLADWSEEQVWEYIHLNNVPYNVLHDQGFPSIGCAPCTRAIEPGEDLRAGRWWWESPEHKECGLHIKDGKVVRHE